MIRPFVPTVQVALGESADIPTREFPVGQEVHDIRRADERYAQYEAGARREIDAMMVKRDWIRARRLDEDPFANEWAPVTEEEEEAWQKNQKR